MRPAGLALAACVALSCGPRVLDAARSGRRTVKLLHVADLHSHVFPERVTLGANEERLGLGVSGQTVYLGGAPWLGSVVDHARSGGAPTLLLDSGDLLEGTATYTLFGGVPELQAAGRLGVDAQALGNHDLSPGAARLEELRGEWAHFPLLAVNVTSPGDLGITPDAMFERGGVRIAVIGLGRLPDRPPDLSTTAKVAQHAVDELRNGSDVMVLLSHLGRQLDLALVPLTTGVDVVLGGHTHDVLEPPAAVPDCGPELERERGCHAHSVLVAHPGAYGRFLGEIELTVSDDPADLAALDANRPSAVVDVRPGLVPVDEHVPENGDMRALLEPYRAAMRAAGLEGAVAYAPAAVSRAPPRGGDSALGNFIADAMRVVTGADVSIVNSTGIRADLAEGLITPEDIGSVLPFDDQLVVRRMTGRELTRGLEAIAALSCERAQRSQVQISGVSLVLGCSAGPTAGVSVAGRPIAAAEVLRVATTSFVAAPGGFLEAGAPDQGGPWGPLRDAMAGYIPGLPPCGGAAPELPCIGEVSGAVVDGRIEWR